MRGISTSSIVYLMFMGIDKKLLMSGRFLLSYVRQQGACQTQASERLMKPNGLNRPKLGQTGVNKAEQAERSQLN